MGKKVVKRTLEEKRFERRVAISIAILIILSLLVSRVAFSQVDYPLPLTNDTCLTVQNDTLWVLTEDQYMQCIYNTVDLIDVYHRMDLLKANLEDKDSINSKLQMDLDWANAEYYAVYKEYEKEIKRKKRWRTAVLIETPLLILSNLIYWKK